MYNPNIPFSLTKSKATRVAVNLLPFSLLSKKNKVSVVKTYAEVESSTIPFGVVITTGQTPANAPAIIPRNVDSFLRIR